MWLTWPRPPGKQASMTARNKTPWSMCQQTLAFRSSQPLPLMDDGYFPGFLWLSKGVFPWRNIWNCLRLPQSVLMSCETTEGDMRIFVLAMYHRLQQRELGYLSAVHRVPHACAGRWCIQPTHLDLRLYSSHKVKVAMDRPRRQKKPNSKQSISTILPSCWEQMDFLIYLLPISILIFSDNSLVCKDSQCTQQYQCYLFFPI